MRSTQSLAHRYVQDKCFLWKAAWYSEREPVEEPWGSSLILQEQLMGPQISFLACLDFSSIICTIKSLYYMVSEGPFCVKMLSVMTAQDRLWMHLNLEGGSHIASGAGE